MTKTIRKGLIAVLLFVMTVLVGVASWTAFGGTARADDNVTKMQQYISAFNGEDKIISSEELFKPDKTYTDNKTNKDLWTAYDNAKALYSELTPTERGQLTDELKKLDELNGVFGEAYGYVASINETMFKITTKVAVDYLKNKPEVVALREKITELEKVENANHAWVPFIQYLTKNYEYLNTAEALMTVVESYFAVIEADILKIKVFNSTSKTMVEIGVDGTKAKNEHYVLSSEETFNVVKKTIEDLSKGVEVKEDLSGSALDRLVDKDALNNALKLLGKFGRTIIISETDIDGQYAGKDNVEHYKEIYKDAEKTLNALNKLVEDLKGKINTVYDQVIDKEVYYSYFNDIKDASDAYKAFDQGKDGGPYTGIKYKEEPADEIDWENTRLGAWNEGGDINYNDLRKKIDKEKHTQDVCTKDVTHPEVELTGKATAALNVMEKYLGLDNEEAPEGSLLDKIADAESAVKAVKAAKEGREYDVAYKTLIDTARTAVNALDKDIQAWDEYFYYMSLKEKPETTVTYDTAKYGTHFPEYAENVGTEGSTAKYIVDDYDALKEAEKQWADWEKQIDDLVAMLEALIEKYNTLEERQVEEKTTYVHPAIAVDLKAIDVAYTELTAKQKDAFDYGTDHKAAPYVKGENEDARKLLFPVVNWVKEPEPGTTETTYPLGGGAEKKQIPKLIVSWFRAKLLEIYTKIGDLSNEIDELDKNNSEDCVFDDYDALKALKGKYDTLDPEEQQYVLNYDKLVALLAEYNAEKELVDAWDTAVKALNFEEVTVWNMDKVEEAIGLWNKLLHQSKPAETLPLEGMSKLQEIVSEHKDYSATSSKFNALKVKYEALQNDLQKLAVAMDKIELKADLTLAGVPDWSNGVDAVTKLYNNFATKYIVDTDTHTAEAGYPGKWWSEDKGTVEFSYDKAGTEPAEKVESTYADAYENYQNALILNERYGVENAINSIYDADRFYDKTLAGHNVDGYETDPDVLIANGKITLDSRDAYSKAEGLYKAYAEKVDDTQAQKDIRNYTKFTAAKAALDKITAELDAWMRSVVQLYKPNFAEDAARSEIDAALDEASDFAGYPLDLNEWKNVSDKYSEVIGDGEDQKAKTEYVSKAKAVLDALKAQSDSVIKDLNTNIAALIEQFKSTNGELTSDELEQVQGIKDTYEKLHDTQKEQIERYDEFKSLIDQLAATEAFKTMLDELYKDVIANKNVTSLTPYYVGVIEAIYDQFTIEIKATFTDYEKKIGEIKAAYKAAEEAGTVLSLNKVQDSLNELDELINGEEDGIVKKLESLLGTEGTIQKLQSQLDALDDLINNEEKGLSALLNKEIGDRETAFRDLQQQINDFKSQLPGVQDKIDSSINTLKSEMEQDLQDAIDELKDTTLKGLLDAQQKAVAEGRTDIYDALDHSVKEVNEKIAELQKSLDAVSGENGTVAQLQSQIANLGKQLAEASSTNSSAQTELRGALTELESKMDKADAELQAQIDKLGSTTNALTAVIIVLAVVLVGAVVCIVLLFLKRNKQ